MGSGHRTVKAYAGYVPGLEQVEYPDADALVVDVPQFDIVVNGIPHNLSYDTSDTPGTLGVHSLVLRMARSTPLLRDGGVRISLAQCRGIISRHRPADHEALSLLRECYNLEELFEHSDSLWNHPQYLRAYRYPLRVQSETQHLHVRRCSAPLQADKEVNRCGGRPPRADSRAWAHTNTRLRRGAAHRPGDCRQGQSGHLGPATILRRPPAGPQRPIGEASRKVVGWQQE